MKSIIIGILLLIIALGLSTFTYSSNPTPGNSEVEVCNNGNCLKVIVYEDYITIITTGCEESGDCEDE